MELSGQSGQPGFKSLPQVKQLRAVIFAPSAWCFGGAAMTVGPARDLWAHPYQWLIIPLKLEASVWGTGAGVMVMMGREGKETFLPSKAFFEAERDS